MTKLPGAVAGARIVGERFVHSQRQQNPEGRMPFMDHIRELRNRVVKIALALVAGMTAGFIFFNQAWRVIERPLCSATIRGHSGCRTLGVDQLVLNGPLDAFYLRVKVALIVGVFWSNDRRRARLHPDPYPGLADDELSPLPSVGPREGRAVFDLSLPKLLVLAVIALVIFGPSELPTIAAQAGRALRDLRKIAEDANSAG